ncbi:MAG: GerAB/ArcD/ProY family transporter [Christensenellales bacterium]
MNNAKPEIKRSQYMLLFAAFIQGSFLLISFSAGLAKQDLWVVLLTAFLISLPLLACFHALSKLFPEKDLVRILETVFGRVAGKTIAVLYVLYFLLLIAFNLYELTAFYTGSVMAETPPAVFLVVMVMLSAFAVSRGITVIAKICIPIVVGSYLVIMFMNLLSTPEMDLANFLPVLEVPFGSYLQSVSIFTAVPFGEAVVFLTMLYAVKEKKKLTRFAFCGFAVGVSFFLLLTFRNITILGPANMVYNQTSYQSVRMIHIGNFLSRVDILAVLNITILMFIKISVIYYATAKSFAGLLRLASYKSFLLPIGAIAAVIALISFPSTGFRIDWASDYTVMFAMPFTVFFPIAALITAKLRKFQKPENALPGEPAEQGEMQA